MRSGVLKTRAMTGKNVRCHWRTASNQFTLLYMQCIVCAHSSVTPQQHVHMSVHFPSSSFFISSSHACSRKSGRRAIDWACMLHDKKSKQWKRKACQLQEAKTTDRRRAIYLWTAAQTDARLSDRFEALTRVRHTSGESLLWKRKGRRPMCGLYIYAKKWQRRLLLSHSAAHNIIPVCVLC